MACSLSQGWPAGLWTGPVLREDSPSGANVPLENVIAEREQASSGNKAFKLPSGATFGHEHDVNCLRYLHRPDILPCREIKAQPYDGSDQQHDEVHAI